MRFYGLDVIRFISFWAISCYHFLYVVWRNHIEEYEFVMSPQPIYSNIIKPFLQGFSFSGFTILLITTFLIGFRNSVPKIHWRLFGFILLAWILFSWADQHFHRITLYWDVYPLLILGLLCVEFLHKKYPNAVLPLGVVGFVMTFIPFYKFQFNLPLFAEQALIGNCEMDLANWPILPWIGLVFFGYALGKTARDHFADLQSIKRGEWIAWAAVLAASAPFLGAFLHLDVEDFECLAYRLPPHEFWAQQMFILFFMRLSIVGIVNEVVKEQLGLVSKLQLSKNFFVVYAISYVLTFVFVVTIGSFLRNNAAVLVVNMLLLYPISEALAWLTTRAGLDKAVRGKRA